MLSLAGAPATPCPNQSDEPTLVFGIKEAHMSRALKASAVVLLLAVAAGCTTPEIIPTVNPQIEVVGRRSGLGRGARQRCVDDGVSHLLGR